MAKKLSLEKLAQMASVPPPPIDPSMMGGMPPPGAMPPPPTDPSMMGAMPPPDMSGGAGGMGMPPPPAGPGAMPPPPPGGMPPPDMMAMMGMGAPAGAPPGGDPNAPPPLPPGVPEGMDPTAPPEVLQQAANEAGQDDGIRSDLKAANKRIDEMKDEISDIHDLVKATAKYIGVSSASSAGKGGLNDHSGDGGRNVGEEDAEKSASYSINGINETALLAAGLRAYATMQYAQAAGLIEREKQAQLAMEGDGGSNVQVSAIPSRLDKTVAGKMSMLVDKEFQSSMLYLAVAGWAAARGLGGIAGWSKGESEEEAGHARKVADFMNSMGAPYSPSVANVDGLGEDAGILDVFMRILGAERELEILYREATEAAASDVLAQNFLQDMYTDQVKACQEALGNCNKIKSAGQNAVILMDHELGD